MADFLLILLFISLMGFSVYFGFQVGYFKGHYEGYSKGYGDGVNDKKPSECIALTVTGTKVKKILLRLSKTLLLGHKNQ